MPIPRNGTSERPGTSRPGTSRPRTGASTRVESQQIICAVSESRSTSPSVGMAFINLDTGEAVISQITDTASYVRTVNKLGVFAPTEVLVHETASSTNDGSMLLRTIVDHRVAIEYQVALLNRRYFSEDTGLEAIRKFAFQEDVEAIKVAIDGHYHGVCCFAAVITYVQLQLDKTFTEHTLRIKYEPSEGAMMMDLHTVQALELMQNIQSPKSKHSLYGLLNETATPMGARLLRSSILQPSTIERAIENRLDAVSELSCNEDMFFATRQALKSFPDSERTLCNLIVIPKEIKLTHIEQYINHVTLVKQFLNAMPALRNALVGAHSIMLTYFLELASSQNIDPVLVIIDNVINEDVHFAKSAMELKNQRVFAVKSGAHDMLDLARQIYKDATCEAYEHMEALKTEHGLSIELKYDHGRYFFLRLPAAELNSDQRLHEIFINVVKKGKFIECQTLQLVKICEKIRSASNEVIGLTDSVVVDLVEALREKMAILYKCSEAIAMIDMLAAFTHIAIKQDYVRPRFDTTLAIQSSRHPVLENINLHKYIPNDVYAAQQSRFQILTGCNMSGKSTYIRSIALITVMAQIGSFVPAKWASIPIIHQIFTRVCTDSNVEANVSSFAAEMSDMAFILKNINSNSMAIIDELGRGTSTRDGLAIALAIAEALLQFKAIVFFATHFQDLATILAERSGVLNLHLSVDIDAAQRSSMTMLYNIQQGIVNEKHYGLMLAKVMDLPPIVMDVAERLSDMMERSVNQRAKTSTEVVRGKRRKVVLSLREQLMQAQSGSMQPEVLRQWLIELRNELMTRMVAIDAEAHEVNDSSEFSSELVASIDDSEGVQE